MDAVIVHAIARHYRRHGKVVNSMTFFTGKKTYFVVICSIIYAVIGFFVIHTMTSDQFTTMIQLALTGAGIRAAIK